MCKYPRPVETFHTPNHVHSGHQQLWGKISWKRTCRPFNTMPQNRLYLPKIGWATFIAAFNLFGTIMHEHLTFQCRGTSKKCYKNTNIVSSQNRNIVLILCPQNSTAQRHKKLSPSKFPPCCHQTKSRIYNTSLAASYTMLAPSTSQC
jgi:hypothetical protein